MNAYQLLLFVHVLGAVGIPRSGLIPRRSHAPRALGGSGNGGATQCAAPALHASSIDEAIADAPRFRALELAGVAP